MAYQNLLVRSEIISFDNDKYICFLIPKFFLSKKISITIVNFYFLKYWL